jgi:hypothetical protein
LFQPKNEERGPPLPDIFDTSMPEFFRFNRGVPSPVFLGQ